MSRAQELKLKLQGELDNKLSGKLKLLDANDLAATQTSRGLPTGWSALDEFVEGGGFPCGELSVLHASAGLGATTLWLESAAKITTQGRRAVWVNGDSLLNPVAASQKGVDLHHLFIVQTPPKRRSWLLQELLSSRLFDLIGCDLGDAHLPLREARSLLSQVRRSGTAVIFLSRSEQVFSCEQAALVLSFHDPRNSKKVEIVRASHRPVPHSLNRRSRHVESITSQCANTRTVAIAAR